MTSPRPCAGGSCSSWQGVRGDSVLGASGCWPFRLARGDEVALALAPNCRDVRHGGELDVHVEVQHAGVVVVRHLCVRRDGWGGREFLLIPIFIRNFKGMSRRTDDALRTIAIIGFILKFYIMQKF